jgi:hypothetical protein
MNAVRRSLRVVLAAAALAVGGSVIVQRAAATRSCGPNRLTLTVLGRTLGPGAHGRQLCVALPAAPRDDAATRQFALRLLVDPAFTSGRVRRALRSAVGRRRSNAVRRGLLGALEPRARAARPSETSTTTVDGVTTTQTVTGSDPDELGSGVRTVVSGKVTGRGEDEAYVKRCPSAEGTVPGQRRYLINTSYAVEALGKRIDITQLLGWEGKLEAHVGDDGRLKDFKYEATGFLEVRSTLSTSTGRLISHMPTRVFRWVLSREGIDPRRPAVGGADFAKSVKWNARGPKGATLGPDEAEGVVKGVVLTEQDLSERGASLYLQAEQSWYDRAECLKAEFNPQSLSGDAGQAFGVDVTVRQVFDKAEVDIHLKAEAGFAAGACAGSIAPAEADAKVGAPAHVTYTAARECGDQDTWPDQMRVEGVSRRGRVSDLQDGAFRRVRMPKAYVGSVSATAENGESWQATGVMFTQAGRPDQYALAGGGATWQLHFEQPGCTSTAGPAQFSLDPGMRDGYDTGAAPGGAILWRLHEGPPRYAAYGTWGKRVMAHMSCPPDFSLDLPYDVEPWWFSTSETEANTTTYRAADPNAALQGTITGTWSGVHITWTWDLAPQY